MCTPKSLSNNCISTNACNSYSSLARTLRCRFAAFPAGFPASLSRLLTRLRYGSHNKVSIVNKEVLPFLAPRGQDAGRIRVGRKPSLSSSVCLIASLKRCATGPCLSHFPLNTGAG